MKIKKIIAVIIISALIIGLTIYGFSTNKVSNSNDITLIKHSKKLISDFNSISKDFIEINNIDEFNKYLGDSNYNTDFSKYKYIYFKIGFDSCSEESVNPYSYTIKDETITINVKYKRHCGLCAISDYYYYIVKVDKKIEKINELEFNYKATNNPHCDPNVAYKPILYLYPKEETNVTVKLGNSNYLTHTYPKYNNNWYVYAYPNGKLIDINTGRELYGLYWEGNNHNNEIKEDGFVVKGEETSMFLEEKLQLLGLTEREADEFIIYWLPILENNKYNYIRFESIDEINNYMPLDINPKPDTVIRVLMDYKPLDEKIRVKEQKISTPTRHGFTAVEWGGSLIQ